MANRHDLAATLAPIFWGGTSEAWLARLEAGGVPAGPVLDVNAMHRDPQTLARANGGGGRAQPASAG